MTNCKYKLRKLSVGLVSVGTMLIAPTVLGQEVSTGASSTETSASSNNTNTNTASTVETSTTTSTSGTAASGTGSEAAVASSGGSQSSGTTPASPQAQTSEQPAVTSASSTSSSSEEKTPQAANTASSSATVASPSNGSNQEASAETEPQMMEVEQYKVDKEETELKVKDGNKLNSSSDKKLIRNRDGEQRDIFDIKREVKTNSDGTIDVTVTVTPKEIDKGADVMALLDVSKKMSEDDFNNAKTKIKQLVKTLTEKNGENHNSRNSVRLMTFYREISDPIDISGKTDDDLDKLLNELREKAKANYDWGVDLQGAIHKAREIFKQDQEKKSGKRQHIVLFSQGESTFSYDIKNKNDRTVTKTRITEKVTTSNQLLPWPPIFDHTHQNADMLDDSAKLINKLKSLGLESLKTADSILQVLGTTSKLAGFLGKSPTEYLTLNEYGSDILKEKQFDYTKRVGEGYYYHSYSDRKSENTMPFESAIRKALTSNFPKLPDNWFFGILNSFVKKETVEKAKLDVIMQVLNSIFYKREYHYYNHNLSAIAEAKMAQEEGITFYSVDVTDLKSKRAKRQTAVRQKTTKKESEEERNKKFDEYLKKMSEGGNFLSKVEERGKFKDTLTELTIKDEFTDKVTVQKDSEGKKYKTSLISGTSNVTHTSATSGFFSSSKESLTWTISKDQLKKAFEDGKPLTLTYKLKVDNNKFKTALEDKKRTKRSAPTENENSIKEKIISNTITYQINQKKGDGKSLGDVSLTYSKFKVPVPQIDGHVIEPQAPKLPDLPPVIEHGPNFEYEEETGYQLPLEHGSNAPDTQVTIEEDTVPQRPDILVGGQSEPIDITEDTITDAPPTVSGHNTSPQPQSVVEDTAPQRPDVLVGGQSEPIDITQDTQPGMSGSNDATVINEDTKPKRVFHFDNKEPQASEKAAEQKLAPHDNHTTPQTSDDTAAPHLPASGDKPENAFALAALTMVAAAGLLSKKRRNTDKN
ncbi:TPA: serum opacification factor [Streptococcus pyogenes]